ncbi:hypothetical protein C0Q70_04244 [Pomacea canaliculata]|uniref:D-isomer specific 2-hydroxyacid dehydrogenase NAD-binding domain-containing protein n=1 Tax=Pomacea canaliculata TaxID=400727 RepID=A0A2T7PV04_POMCA|nr:hypothetical protein C0Q70_04244 [Pomacea canaliculata]
MTSSKPVLHIAEWEPKYIIETLHQLAPDLAIRRIPVPDFYSICQPEDIGNPEEIELLVCSPFFLIKLTEAGIHLPNLRWVHSVAAGLDKIKGYFKETKPEPRCLLTRAPRINGACVAEYVVGQILCTRRQFLEFYDQQRVAVWNRRTGLTESLNGATVVVLGMGNIGTRVAKLCKAFEMVVHGVTRSPVTSGQGSPHVDVYWTSDQLEQALAEADVIVSCLPSSPQTVGLLDNRLQVCQKKTKLDHKGGSRCVCCGTTTCRQSAVERAKCCDYTTHRHGLQHAHHITVFLFLDEVYTTELSGALLSCVYIIDDITYLLSELFAALGNHEARGLPTFEKGHNSYRVEQTLEVMMSSKPVIHIAEWESASITQSLRKLAPELTIRRVPVPDFYSPGLPEDVGNPGEIELLVCSPFFVIKLADTGIHLPNLRWMHSMAAAGASLSSDARATHQRRECGRVCGGPDPVHQRQFLEFYDQQRVSVWNRRTGLTESLNGATVVVLGMGNIGTRDVRDICVTYAILVSLTSVLPCHSCQNYAKRFEMVVHGVTRSAVTSGQGSPHVDVYWTSDQLEQALAEADVIVSCLPSSPQTVGLLDNNRLQVCQKKKPVLISVGRGDVISEESIIKAVRLNWITKAVLDVFAVEPLPADSPLWKEPNVVITPHIAMDYNSLAVSQIARHILDNYKRFLNNEPLVDVVDITNM